MVDYPILEKDEEFIKKFTDIVLKGISDKNIRINFTRNGYGLGIKQDFLSNLKKEFIVDEKILQRLISSLFEIYIDSINKDKLMENLKEKFPEKISLILSLFPNETTEDIFLKSKSTGNFLENVRWNLIKLEGTSETAEKLPQFKYIEVTFEYSNPQTHIDHYETITLKISKKELARLISTLNDINKKFIENE